MPFAFSSKSVTRESKTVKYFWAGAWLQWSTIYSFAIHGWKCLVHSSHPLPEGLYSTDPYVIHTLLWKVEGKEEMSLGASHACGRCEVLSFVWQGHNSEAKGKEIDSAARRNSTTLKCEGKTEGGREKCILGTTWFCTEQKNYLLSTPPPSPYAAFKIPPSWLERTRIWRYSCVWSPGLSETSSCFVFITWCSKKWNPRWLIR